MNNWKLVIKLLPCNESVYFDGELVAELADEITNMTLIPNDETDREREPKNTRAKPTDYRV